jgi:hypothetical protein
VGADRKLSGEILIREESKEVRYILPGRNGPRMGQVLGYVMAFLGIAPIGWGLGLPLAVPVGDSVGDRLFVFLALLPFTLLGAGMIAAGLYLGRARRWTEVIVSGGKLQLVRRTGRLARTRARRISRIREIVPNGSSLCVRCIGEKDLDLGAEGYPSNWTETLREDLARQLKLRADPVAAGGPGSVGESLPAPVGAGEEGMPGRRRDVPLGLIAWNIVEETYSNSNPGGAGLPGCLLVLALLTGATVVTTILVLIVKGPERAFDLGNLISTVLLSPGILGAAGGIIAIGYFILKGVLSYVHHFRLPPAAVTASVQPLRLGETFHVQVRLQARSRVHLRWVTLALLCREKAIRHILHGGDGGTSTTTYIREIHRRAGKPIDERTIEKGGILETREIFRIPCDGMHTFQASNNKIEWFIEVGIEFASGLQETDRYALEVAPERSAGEEEEHGGGA